MLAILGTRASASPLELELASQRDPSFETSQTSLEDTLASSISPDDPLMQQVILEFFAEPEAGDILEDD